MPSNSTGPDASRKCLSLDGPWRFRHESDGVARTAIVPMPWQAQFDDLRQISGKAVYERDLGALTAAPEQEIAVKFGAVSYYCEVFLNNLLIGSHEGGYLPFECVLPAPALKSANMLAVHVTLPTGDGSLYPDFPFPEIPHGKQSWYGPIGGIWQSVQLEARNRWHIVSTKLTASLDKKTVDARVEVTPIAIGSQLIITITDPQGKEVSATSVPIESSITNAQLALAAVAPWSPEAPNLYTVHVEMRHGTITIDSQSSTCGFRHFETRDGKFYLNGAPYLMRGALDQDYYPQGICTPPSVAFLEDQLRKAKELGLNMLRCHIKVPDPRYYEVADRLGVLIWTEIPNVATFTAKSAARMRTTMEGILARDFNHPCIVIWTIINEDWGTRVMEDTSHRSWLIETYDWLKALDPTRLVVDNSPCHNNFHVKTDINDFHYYRSVPERRREWDKLTDEFAAGADWTYSPYGDAVRRGDEPLVVSEFGVWGLPDISKMIANDGSEPWWMETGPGWGDGAAYPHGIQNRFATYQLGATFGSFQNFIDAVQWYQFSNLKYQIESMRAHKSIQGYVITELTDVHWEANGLLDMDRNPRIFHNRFAEINSDIIIVPELEFYAVSAGKKLTFGLKIATGGKAIDEGCVLHWSVGDIASGKVPVPQTGALDVVDLGIQMVAIPVELKSQTLALSLYLRNGTNVVAKNQVEIALYAKRHERGLPAITTTDPLLAAFARGLGYRNEPENPEAICLARALDASDIARMQAGGRYLVLADGSDKTYGNLRTDEQRREQPFMAIVDEVPGNLPNPDGALPNISLVARQGTMWRGDWIASFSWIRRDGAFKDIPGGPLLDISFDRVAPHHVLTGFRPWEYDSFVHSALVVGWAHKPAVLIGARRVGAGKLIATTYRLTGDEPGADPVASALFDALVISVAGAEKGG